MKLLFVGLLFILPFNCHRYPDHARFICSKRYCRNFTAKNQLTIEFSNAHFFYTSGKKKSIAIECVIINKNRDSLLFDIRDFSISSKNGEYDIVPRQMAKAFNVKTLSDTFKIAPGRTDVNYYFAFISKNTMSEKKYYNILLHDTVSFEYANSNYRDTVFLLVGRVD